MKRIGLIVLAAVAAVFAGGCGQGESSLCDRAAPEANLRQADLSGCDLSFKVLTKADFSGTNLSGANLQNANLQGANLERADLQDANLKNADLSGADLTGADIEGTDLSGAVLKGTVLVDIVGIPAAGPAKFGVFHKKKDGRSTEAGKKLTAEEAAAVLAYWIGEWEYESYEGFEEPTRTKIEKWVFRWKEKGKSIEGSGSLKISAEVFAKAKKAAGGGDYLDELTQVLKQKVFSGLQQSSVEEFDPVKGVFIVQRTISKIGVDTNVIYNINRHYDPTTRIYRGIEVEVLAEGEGSYEVVTQIKNPDLVTSSYSRKVAGKLDSVQQVVARRLK